jgi:hypothetical protein
VDGSRTNLVFLGKLFEAFRLINVSSRKSAENSSALSENEKKWTLKLYRRLKKQLNKTKRQSSISFTPSLAFALAYQIYKIQNQGKIK